MQYKSIPFTARITRQDNSATVAAQVQAMIDIQALQGYSFVRIEQTKTLVASESGCFGLNNLPAYMTRNAIVIFERADNNTEFILQIENVAQNIPIAINATPIPTASIPIVATSSAPPIILTKKIETTPIVAIIPTIANNTTPNTTPDNQQKPLLMIGAGILLFIFSGLVVVKCNQNKQANYENIAQQEEADRAARKQATDDSLTQVLALLYNEIHKNDSDNDNSNNDSRVITGEANSLYITGDNVNIRAKPTITSDIVTTISSFQSIAEYKGNKKIDDRGVEWYNIKYGTDEGWISNKFASFNPNFKDLWKKTNTNDPNDNTNVRETPSLDAKILDKVSINDRFTVMSCEGDWCLVILKNESRGYIYKSKIVID